MGAAESDLPGRVTSATLLDDGQILLIGDTRASGNWSGVYDPAAGATTPIQPMRAWNPKATRLADGHVLIVGGLLPEDLRPPGTEDPGASTVEIFQ